MKLTQEQKAALKTRILILLSKNPRFTYEDIAEKCGLTRQTVSKYIDELKQEGKLFTENDRILTEERKNRTYDDTMFIDTFEHEYTWLNGFMRNVRRYATTPAIIDPETNRSWTYSELNAEVNKVAHALKERRVGRGDVVMFALRNCPEFAVTYVAPRKTGAVLLEANSNLAAGEMALLIEFNEPKVVFYSANIALTVCEAVKMSSFKPDYFVLCDNIEKIPVPENHITYEQFIEGKSEEDVKLDFRPHIYDEVLRLCTSGTTALPKSVPINDINEVLSAHDVIMQYPLNHLDRTLNMTPWFHRGGCHCAGPSSTFYVGATVVVARRFNPKTVLDWVKEFSITFLIGSPSNLEMLARAQEASPRDLSGLKGVVTMGAPLSRADGIRYLNLISPNIFNGYGTTETFWNSFLRPYDLPKLAGSVGSSCIDDEVRVVKLYKSGERAEPDDMIPHDRITEGEVIVKSPAKSSYSYYKNEEVTRERYYNGWYYTGDIGTWDENWVVTIRGRKDDMMVVSAENIYPSQVEDAINLHPKVKDSIVTSIPDKIRGQAIVAYVVPEDDTLTIEEIAQFCAKSPMLSKYKRPRYYAFIKEIPFTATGKKCHYQMKERAVTDLETGFLRRS